MSSLNPAEHGGPSTLPFSADRRENKGSTSIIEVEEEMADAPAVPWTIARNHVSSFIEPNQYLRIIFSYHLLLILQSLIMAITRKRRRSEGVDPKNIIPTLDDGRRTSRFRTRAKITPEESPSGTSALGSTESSSGTSTASSTVSSTRSRYQAQKKPRLTSTPKAWRSQYAFSYVQESRALILVLEDDERAQNAENSKCPNRLGKAKEDLIQYNRAKKGDWCLKNWADGVKRDGTAKCTVRVDKHSTACAKCELRICQVSSVPSPASILLTIAPLPEQRRLTVNPQNCLFDPVWAPDLLDEPTFKGTSSGADIHSLRRRVLCTPHWAAYLSKLPADIVQPSMGADIEPELTGNDSDFTTPALKFGGELSVFCECRSALRPFGLSPQQYCIECYKELAAESLDYRSHWQGESFGCTAPCAEAGCTERVKVQVPGQAGLVPQSSHNLCAYCMKIVPLHPWRFEAEAPFHFPDKTLCGPRKGRQETLRPAYLRQRRLYKAMGAVAEQPTTKEETLYGVLPQSFLLRSLHALAQLYGPSDARRRELGETLERWRTYPVNWPEFWDIHGGSPFVNSPHLPLAEGVGAGDALQHDNLHAHEPLAAVPGMGMEGVQGSKAKAGRVIRRWALAAFTNKSQELQPHPAQDLP